MDTVAAVAQSFCHKGEAGVLTNTFKKIKANFTIFFPDFLVIWRSRCYQNLCCEKKMRQLLCWSILRYLVGNTGFVSIKGSSFDRVPLNFSPL